MNKEVQEYVDESFVRLIPFKDHINIEAKPLVKYKDELDDYKMTPKGMLQIFVNQEIPEELLLKVFQESLEDRLKNLDIYNRENMENS